MEVADAISRALEFQLDGRWEDALQLLLQAAEEHEDEDLWGEIALLYTERGTRRPDALAMIDFQEAQKWADLPATRVAMAGVLARQGDFDKAEPLLRPLIEEDVNFAPALTGLGELRFHQGRADEAQEYLVHAIQAGPREGRAYAMLAGLLASLGRTDESDRVLEVGQKMAPGEEVTLALARSYLRKENFVTARRALREVLGAAPERAEAWRWLAWLEAVEERETEMREALGRAMSLDPDVTRAWLATQSAAVPLLAK